MTTKTEDKYDALIKVLAELLLDVLLIVLAWLGWKFGLAVWFGLPDMNFWQFIVTVFVISRILSLGRSKRSE